MEAKLHKIITITQSKVILMKAVEKIQCVENPVSKFTVQQSAIFGYNMLRLCPRNRLTNVRTFGEKRTFGC
jgi:hypothetical protein